MNELRNRILAGAVAVSAILSTGVARADAIAPDEGACTGKSAGAACVLDGVDGKCATKKCTKLDYSDGSPPGTKEVDCLVCVALGVADGGGSNGADASTPRGSDGGTSSTSSSSDDGGCSIAQTKAARTFGPWLLAALPLAVLRAFSRKRKGDR